MPESKRPLDSNLVRLDATTDEDIARQIAEDPDTAPELSNDSFDKADFYSGAKLVRRGRGRSQRRGEE